MKLLSIDIGIKNLAFTIIDHTFESLHFQIIKWDILNLCNYIPNCSICNCKKQAKFSKVNNFYCRQHSKLSEYKIPDSKINMNTLKKQNMKTLSQYAQDNHILFEKNIGKKELIKLIEEHLNNIYLDIIEIPNANNVNLIDLGINLKQQFNKLFSEIDLSTIDLILLENQIGPIANRMKTLQGMIAQYFIDCNNYKIEFMSAANKLKLFNENKKSTYNERKKLSIEYTRKLLKNKNMTDNCDFFNAHGKKDDLADCLLQGIYYLSTFNKLSEINK